MDLNDSQDRWHVYPTGAVSAKVCRTTLTNLRRHDGFSRPVSKRSPLGYVPKKEHTSSSNWFAAAFYIGYRDAMHAIASISCIATSTKEGCRLDKMPRGILMCVIKTVEV
jgi:hypothetical protein